MKNFEKLLKHNDRDAMPPSADRLVKIHQALTDALESVHKDVRSSCLQDKLRALEDFFSQWMILEDEKFFLYIEKQTQFCDIHSLQLLNFFRSDLKYIQLETTEFLEFYGWEKVFNSSEKHMFPLAFMKFSKRVQDRIDAEKEYLVPCLT